MTLDEIAERMGKSKRTVMRMVKQGRFPKPTIRNGRLIEWNETVVERWVRHHRRHVRRIGDRLNAPRPPPARRATRK